MPGGGVASGVPAMCGQGGIGWCGESGRGQRGREGQGGEKCWRVSGAELTNQFGSIRANKNRQKTNGIPHSRSY